MSNKIPVESFSQLASIIEETHFYFLQQVQKQVNIALTLRNWLIGQYIVEYEQNGADRAEYGKALITKLSQKLRQRNLKGFSEIALRLNRSFYLNYPGIQQTLSVNFQLADSQNDRIQPTLSVELQTATPVEVEHGMDVSLLLNHLSFSHFIELIKTANPVARSFYEIETLKNNWTVRQLQRAMNSMLYERTGLSKEIKTPTGIALQNEKTDADSMFRNPLILDFLGLEEKIDYSESDLEQAIINHLQSFLLEIGRGFCFEARQKRITFDNTHYRIDLVFYHRILKCHVLFDLKIGEFTHADSGQMNVYLNYYKENEMEKGDQPPVGIILCASNNENLVKYATAGLPHKLFVSKYMINLPKEEELKKLIQTEQDKFKQDKLRQKQ
jgi:predicted nuclease of restriction endonuclease-like (RecB) superfamily